MENKKLGELKAKTLKSVNKYSFKIQGLNVAAALDAKQSSFTNKSALDSHVVNMTTTASISSNNINDMSLKKKSRATSFILSNAQDLTSNVSNSAINESGTSPSFQYARAALLKLKESLGEGN